MRALGRLPAYATTGVGSLPFADPHRAVAHVRASYDVPFCPQLPAVDGDMLGEWLGADPRRCGFSTERQRPHPAAWEAFVASLATGPPIHGLVKLQVTGPVTLAFGLGLRARDPDLPGLAADLARWAAVSVGRWVAEVAGLGLTALVVVDEPGLAAAARAPVLRAWDPIRAVSPLFGLHVCGEVPWRLVAALRPDVLSFDATRPELAGGALRRASGDLSRLGIRAAPGVVPVCGVHGRTDGPTPAQVTGFAPALITPACGTGLRTEAEERAIAARLRTLALAARDAPPQMAGGELRERGSLHG
jgi:hypothetical protein